VISRIGSSIAADTSPSMHTSETVYDRSAECLENVCWRRKKPVTVNAIELVEV